MCAFCVIRKYVALFNYTSNEICLLQNHSCTCICIAIDAIRKSVRKGNTYYAFYFCAIPYLKSLEFYGHAFISLLRYVLIDLPGMFLQSPSMYMDE